MEDQRKHMGEQKMKNNLVAVTGQIGGELEFSHERGGEHFYKTDLIVERKSKARDQIPVIVSDRVMDVSQVYSGSYVSVHGQFQSRNYKENDHIKTALSVLVRDAEVMGDEEQAPQDRIYLEGFVCKKPVHRRTPAGKEITELILAVNRKSGKTDYIPCISWGRTARFAANFNVGCHLLVWGRIQSREYSKKMEDDVMKCVTYEVSVARLEIY